MATVYDWSPLFEAINGATNKWSQQNQYNSMLNGLIGKQVPGQTNLGLSEMAPQQTTIDATAPNIPGAPAPVQRSATATIPGMAGTAATQGAPTYDGMAGQALGANAAPMLSMLRNAPPSIGLPLLLNLATKNAERQQNIQDARVTPLSDDEAKTVLGAAWKPDAKYGRDISGNVVTIQKGETLSQAAVNQQYGMKRMEGQIAAEAPLTQAQVQEHNDRQAQIGVSASQPHFVPYGTSSYIQNGKLVNIGGGVGGGAPSVTPGGDPNSMSPNGQLGISSNAYNLLIGNTAAVPRGRPMELASHELDQMIQQRGLDPSIVKPRVQAYGDAVKMNTLKANTMDTLSNELTGTIQNLMPVADKLGGGNIRWTKEGAQIIGGIGNNPNAQQYVYYLNQLRSELAGFNAVAGGKIGLHGQVEVNESHIAEAEKVIRNGLDSGGAKGLGAAIEASRTKNIAVVEHQSNEAQRGIWNVLGLGPQYDKLHAPKGGAGGGGNVTKQFHYDAAGNRVPN